MSTTVTEIPTSSSTDGLRALRAWGVALLEKRVSPADAGMVADLVSRGYPLGLAVRVALTPTFRHQRGGDDR